MQFNPDPCSYANITELRTSAIYMDLVMSFEGEALSLSPTDRLSRLRSRLAGGLRARAAARRQLS